MEGEENHFLKGIAVSLGLHLLLGFFLLAAGTGTPGAVRVERSVEVSLRNYEPGTEEKELKTGKEKSLARPEKKEAAGGSPALVKSSKTKKATPAETKKKPVAAKAPRTAEKTAERKEPEAVEEPAEKRRIPEPRKERKPSEEEKTAETAERSAVARKKEVLRDIRKESVIRSLAEKTAKTAEIPLETEYAEVAEKKAVPTEEKIEPPGNAATEPVLKSAGKNPESAGAGKAAEETSSKVLSLTLDLYYKAISRHIEKNLVLPPNIEPRGFLTALVGFRMRRNGDVYNVEIKGGSGNEIFDSYCIKAVNASSPLPAPPTKLQGRAGSESFVVPCKSGK